MHQLPGSQYRMQFGLKGWAAVAVGVTALVAVAAALAIGFVFIVLPMIVLAPLIYWFTPKRKINVVRNPGSTANGSTPGTIIDGTYREMDKPGKSKF